MAGAERPILLDPGHGGSASAGRSSPLGHRLPDGRWEKDEALAEALSLAAALERLGLPVHLTRRDDRNLSLAARLAAAAALSPRIFLSVHISPEAGRVALAPDAGPESLALGTALSAGLGLPLLRLPLALLGADRLPPGAAACQVELPASRDDRRLGGPRLASALAAAWGRRGPPRMAELRRPADARAALVINPEGSPDGEVWTRLFAQSLGLAPTRIHHLAGPAATGPAAAAQLDRLAEALGPGPTSLALCLIGRGRAGATDAPGAFVLADGALLDPGDWRAQREAGGLRLWVIADAGSARAPLGAGRSVNGPPAPCRPHPDLTWVCATTPGEEAFAGPAGGLFTEAAVSVLRDADMTLSAGAFIQGVDAILRRRTVQLGLPVAQRPWTDAPARLLLDPVAEAAPPPPVRHFVPLVAQQTGMSCWAAGAAMLVGWRDLHPTTDRAVAERSSRMEAFRLGLLPSDIHAIAAAYGLHAEPPRAYGVTELWQTLADCGPLWVGEADPELHVVVIAGIEGDGTPDGTRVFVVDPWPVGQGERYTLTFRELMRNYQAASTLAGFEAQILHAGGRPARPT